ncbi:MAG: NAD(P)/FAD-dependent oxidoreductase [Salinivirgaceae bacterium]|nr:NAD(P)/FAD-dependent oxidoreductase [Salinivirgaceae bacterium]
MKYDVAIIGSGLGGLQCAYILARKGLNVCVLEKNPVVGGCLQTFRRNGVEFDTGFHYVGGLDDGQPLNAIFHYFNLLHLPWHRWDNDAFDEVRIGGQSYFFANGYQHFADTLAEQFPHQRDNLKRYVEMLKTVGDGLKNSLLPHSDEEVFSRSLFTRSAYEFLCETITDPLLRDVVSGTSLKMELNRRTLPLYVFAQINSSFIQSAWRLNGGGQLIADELVKSIRQMGGTVLTLAGVVELVERDGRLAQAIVDSGESVEAEWFISDIHPAATLDLIKESTQVRKIYRRRIGNLQNTFGMFTVNVALKDGTVPYLNRNQYVYRTGNVWSLADYADRPTPGILLSYRAEADNRFARNIDLLTPMYWPEVERWADTKVGRRGTDYEDFKRRKTDECLALAAEVIPNLTQAVEKTFSSTPLTYRDYTATAQGAAYGIRKDYNNPMLTLLTPRTPVPNLLLTGQNLNLHGVLGVSMSSFFTCAEILGMAAATDGLKFED